MQPREHQSSSRYRHKIVSQIGFMCVTGSSVQYELPCVSKGLLLFSDKVRFSQNGAWDHPFLLGNPILGLISQVGDSVGNILSGHCWFALEVTAIAMHRTDKPQIWLISWYKHSWSEQKILQRGYGRVSGVPKHFLPRTCWLAYLFSLAFPTCKGMSR